MKHRFFLFILLLALLPIMPAASESLPAFPRAEDSRASLVSVFSRQTPDPGSADQARSWGENFGIRFSEGKEEVGDTLTFRGTGVAVGDCYVLCRLSLLRESGETVIPSPESDTVLTAVTVARDEALDLAVLYVKDASLSPAPLDDSVPGAGDWALYVFPPASRDHPILLDAGVLSGTLELSLPTYDIYGLKARITRKLILGPWTDAASGALFSPQGDLLGIPAGPLQGYEGMGFFIPVSEAMPMIRSVLSEKPVRSLAREENRTVSASADLLSGRPRMGVRITVLSPAVTITGLLPSGALVTEVERNSPADRAGMQNGDIIVQIGDQIIRSDGDLQTAILGRKAGETVSVRVYRVKGLLQADNLSGLEEGTYLDMEVTLATLESILR